MDGSGGQWWRCAYARGRQVIAVELTTGWKAGKRRPWRECRQNLVRLRTSPLNGLDSFHFLTNSISPSRVQDHKLVLQDRRWNTARKAFALQQWPRDRGAVQLYKRPPVSQTLVVNGACNDLFPRAGFPLDTESLFAIMRT